MVRNKSFSPSFSMRLSLINVEQYGQTPASAVKMIHVFELQRLADRLRTSKKPKA